MNTKLTLTIEHSVIERSKKYAKDNGKSLSEIIESYLNEITKEEAKSQGVITPLVKSLQGSFNKPSRFDYKKALMNGLTEKYR